MADTTYYVDTDVSGGAGDGSSWANAYASLNDAENARNADITAVGIITFLCRGSTNADTATYVDGWTTDSTHYIVIQAEAEDRHAGLWSTSKYRLVKTSGNAFRNLEDYTIVDGLQFNSDETVVTTGGVKKPTFKNNIIKGADSANMHGIAAPYIDSEGGYFYNNILYNFNGTNGCGINTWNTSGVNSYYYNNTFVNCTTGLATEGAIAKNNLFYNCTTATTGLTGGANVDYNATDLTGLGYTDTGGHSHVSHTFTFVGAADFHLQSSDSGAIDLGVDLSGTFTTDIDGQTRSGTWDIGADEYVAAGGSTIWKSQRRKFQHLVVR